MRLLRPIAVGTQDSVRPGELVRCIAAGADGLVLGIVTRSATSGFHLFCLDGPRPMMEVAVASTKSFPSYGADWILDLIWPSDLGRQSTGIAENPGTIVMSKAGVPLLCIGKESPMDISPRYLNLDTSEILEAGDFGGLFFPQWRIWPVENAAEPTHQPLFSW